MHKFRAPGLQGHERSYRVFECLSFLRVAPAFCHPSDLRMSSLLLDRWTVRAQLLGIALCTDCADTWSSSCIHGFSTQEGYRPDYPFGPKHVASLITLYLIINMFVLRYVDDQSVMQKCDVLCCRRKNSSGGYAFVKWSVLLRLGAGVRCLLHTAACVLITIASGGGAVATWHTHVTVLSRAVLTHWGRVTQICVFYITTVKDGWRKSAFLRRACFPCTIHLIMQYIETVSEWPCWRMFIEIWPHSELTFRHRASSI